ncbi:MAG TPA: hypothetical protein VIW69_09700 [Candidatus Elarobacter sp.]
MADRVFGPHVSGLNVLGIHIGATTEVFCDAAGGKTVPGSLSVVLSAPLGQSATIATVANGQSATVQVTPGISVTGTINNCSTKPAAGDAPELFVFQFVLRATGSVKVGGIFSVPVSAQIDAFDVHVPTDEAVHARIAGAQTA